MVSGPGGGHMVWTKPLVRAHMLILTVGDTSSTDDQVFVCQLSSVIEVRCGDRITIRYAFALFTDTGVIGIGVSGALGRGAQTTASVQ